MNSWPNPDKPGVPLNPEKDGWHFVERQKEITAIEWISGEWWTGGLGTYGGGYYNSEYIGLNYTYLGPCLTPSEVAAQVEQARREGMEEAAKEVDCGCDIREAVLARLESQGEKRASYLCTHGDVCSALQAAAIRAAAKEARDE